MFPDKSEWQGQNTFSPDCSNKAAAPWGFDTFDKGTVGGAILDWIINTWDEIDVCFGLTLDQVVLEEFDFYINNLEIAERLATSWIEEHAELLTHLVGDNPERILIYESKVKEWLKNKIQPFMK